MTRPSRHRRERAHAQRFPSPRSMTRRLSRALGVVRVPLQRAPDAGASARAPETKTPPERLRALLPRPLHLVRDVFMMSIHRRSQVFHVEHVRPAPARRARRRLGAPRPDVPASSTRRRPARRRPRLARSSARVPTTVTAHDRRRSRAPSPSVVVVAVGRARALSHRSVVRFDSMRRRRRATRVGAFGRVASSSVVVRVRASRRRPRVRASRPSARRRVRRPTRCPREDVPTMGGTPRWVVIGQNWWRESRFHDFIHRPREGRRRRDSTTRARTRTRPNRRETSTRGDHPENRDGGDETTTRFDLISLKSFIHLDSSRRRIGAPSWGVARARDHG